MSKILIIKTGYSETLDPEVSDKCSLGDIVRTTPILHCFSKDHVTWLTDKKAYPLLHGIGYIDRILIYNMNSILQLQEEEFDIIINLEKVPGICALTNKIKAWTKYGFRFDTLEGTVKPYHNTHEAYYVYNSLERKREADRYWQDVLFEIIGMSWAGENYIVPPIDKIKKKFDVGINFRVGPKWTNKSWPISNWKLLGKSLFKNGYSVGIQQGEKEIDEYIKWINSCELIITCDSLGLHLAMGYGVKAVGLFGPTSNTEVHMYNDSKMLIAKGDCVPCLQTSCCKEQSCMETIRPELVYQAVKSLLHK
jgi:heptosyltransferase II